MCTDSLALHWYGGPWRKQETAIGKGKDWNWTNAAPYSNEKALCICWTFVFGVMDGTLQAHSSIKDVNWLYGKRTVVGQFLAQFTLESSVYSTPDILMDGWNTHPWPFVKEELSFFLSAPPPPSIAFRHVSPNSARFGYATDGALFISAQLSTDAVSALRKIWVLIWL